MTERDVESIIVNDTPVLRLVHPLTLSIELNKVKIKLNARACALCKRVLLALPSSLIQATLPRLRHGETESANAPSASHAAEIPLGAAIFFPTVRSVRFDLVFYEYRILFSNNTRN